METTEKLRADKYLWAIRLFKTRSQAAEACDKGKVRMNGVSIKAAKTIHTGDELEVKTEARRWVIKITGLLHNRVHYIDITASEEVGQTNYQPSTFHTGKRQSKIGRPTKKERRDLGDILDE